MLALGRVLASIAPNRAARDGDELLELGDRYASTALTNQVADPLKPTLAELRQIGKTLSRSRAHVTALDRRLAWLCEELGFDENDRKILGAIARWELHDSWRDLMRILPPWGGTATATKLAILAGLPLNLVEQRLSPGSRLLRSELVRDGHKGEFEVAGLLKQILRTEADSLDSLIRSLLPEGQTARLDWEDFAHLGPHRDLAEGILATRAPVSILLYGEPGTGKTEFARALAGQTGANGIFVGLQSDDGCEPDRRDRIAHLMLVRVLCRHDQDSIVIVDEADDILAPRNPKFASKQWVNLLIEEPKVSTIWILNDASKLDPSTLRRMTLAIGFRRPPIAIRRRITRRAADAQGVALSEAEVEDIASLPANPALVSAGLRAAHLTGGGAQTARLAIGGLSKAMDQPCFPERDRAGIYDPALSSADCDLVDIALRLESAQSRQWSLLLAGPSGTGKSAFGRYVAERLGIVVHEHAASNLLGPYVGETEHKIAAAFARAANDGAMLLIDEVDSFLYRREPSRRSWEKTIVNEMLQQMEHLHTPFIATTNLADQLDSAVQRRFTLRVTFKAMARSQVIQLFEAWFGQSWPEGAPVPDILTPGDFAVVASRATLLGETRPEVLLQWLHDEIAQRGEHTGSPVGFRLPEPSFPTVGPRGC